MLLIWIRPKLFDKNFILNTTFNTFDWSRGLNSKFRFLRVSTVFGETVRSLGKHWDSREKQKQILKNALRFQQQHQATFNWTLWSRATAVNISRVTVNCFPFDIIVSAMLPAHGIWRETVSLFDVMWPWTSMGALWREKRQLYNKFICWENIDKCILFSRWGWIYCEA